MVAKSSGVPSRTVPAIAGSRSAATAGSVNTWYRTLHKPAWNPPDWIFGPVWTTLYVLLAVADKVGWGRTKYEKGRGVGLAFHLSHGGYFAQAAEVTVFEVIRIKFFLSKN